MKSMDHFGGNYLIKIKFVIPKGSLETGTYEVLKNGGYEISGRERTYRPSINDSQIELKVLRPQEIPLFVSEGLHDLGITGQDWIWETEAKVETLLDLEYGRIKIILAIPKIWDKIESLSELIETFWQNKRNIRITTEYLNLTAKHIKANSKYQKYYGDAEPLVITPWWRKGTNSRVSIFLSFGATEAKPPEDADAIIDVVETGVTIEQNNLKIIEVVAESSAVLVANRKSLENLEKREKIYDILSLLKGVVDGRKRLHIFVNVKEENLQKLISKLPSLKGPTVSPLSAKGWYSVNTVIDSKDFLEILPALRRLAQGIVVHEPRQILSLEEILEGEKNNPNPEDSD
ncbi:MAG: phosphoribosyltransferase [Thermoproteota archaeon]|nr:phosphoribosyltransferase [Thermoproteota archaeon]